MSFIAISLGTDQMNVQLALSNTSAIYFKFPMSLSIALMTYIGNEMGKGDIKGAKKYAYSGIGIYIVFTIIFSSLIFFLRF